MQGNNAVNSNDPRRVTAEAKRIVIKVGSSSLTQDGAICEGMFETLASQIATLQKDGRQVALVTSGAVAAGSHALGWGHAGHSIPEKQAAAAVGQIHLMERYRTAFAKHGTTVAQILVTKSGLDDRERFINARHTLLRLLQMNVVPIVNENDTVSPVEIRFGDNDNLSATVVNLINAELLIILSDVDGLHVREPQRGVPLPPIFEVIDEITPEIEKACRGSDSQFGSGGMITKLEAARSARHSGAATLLCNSREPDVLLRAVRAEPLGTLFLAGPVLRGRKHWLAFTAHPRGRITIDEGAVKALLKNGPSLLPAGIRQVEGEFGMGDLVTCIDPTGREIARGLANYGASEIRRIMGASTSEIESRLGYSYGAEVIHRDDLVLTRGLNLQTERSSAR